MALLKDLIQPASLERCGDRSFPVLSMTMHDGIMLQSDRFKKSLASVDQSAYKVVRRNQLVVGFPIDEGVLYIQQVTDAGIMSPAYDVWNVDDTKVDLQYFELCLHSPQSMMFYKTKLRGTTARRRSLPKDTLLSLPVHVPSLERQREIASTIGRLKELIHLRQRQLRTLDTLIKARFVEMFGDPEINPKGWKKELLKDHADVMVGYPFSSEGYTSEGTDIVGGYNLMQGYIQWDESKRWPDTEGYEQYLLQANDIVMAMDRPWVNDGFKIARVDAAHLPALLIQRTACIRGKGLEQEFLHSLLDTKRFAAHCNITGSLVPHISNKDINSFSVIIPPIEEQRRFVAFVSQVDKSKAAVQAALDKAQLLFDSLMQQYFG